MVNGWKQKAIRVGVSITVLGALVWSGTGAGTGWGTKAVWAAESQQDALTRLGEVYGTIQSQHVSGISDEKLTDAAIRGMIAALNDPYTVYFTKEEYEAFTNEVEMTYVGIGTSLTQDDSGVRIVEVFAGSPAAQAGILAGDYIEAVGGAATKGKSLEQVTEEVKGKEGTTVELTLRRGDQTVKVAPTRKPVSVPSVTSRMLSDGTGYIRISGFGDTTDELFGEQLEQLQQAKAQRLIVDLRDNPGGRVDSAQHIAEQFIPEGTLIHTKNRNGQDEPVKLTGGKSVSVPVVMLVNGDSASASEILAGALQDYGKASIVGEKTYGKGSVQSIYTLSSGGAIKVTIEEYYTPNGHPVNKVGITPDVEAEGGVLQLLAALRIAGSPELTLKLSANEVSVNGLPVQDAPLQPQYADGRLYIPARWAAAMAGARLVWNGEKQAIELSSAAGGTAAATYGAGSGFLNVAGTGYVDALLLQQQFPSLTWSGQGAELELHADRSMGKGS